MAYRKIIYWRKEVPPNNKGDMYAHIHLIGGYGKSLKDFNIKVQELRKTFPQIRDKQIQCGHITDSDSMKGFAIISYGCYLPQSTYEGWEQVREGRVPYSFA